jgi:hypothetical protein
MGTFQFKMQVKKNITKYVILCNITRNMQEMPKYVKLCRLKFNCSNANAAIRGDYYFLSIYVVRNKIYIYIKYLALAYDLFPFHRGAHGGLSPLESVTPAEKVLRDVL